MSSPPNGYVPKRSNCAAESAYSQLKIVRNCRPTLGSGLSYACAISNMDMEEMGRISHQSREEQAGAHHSCCRNHLYPPRLAVHLGHKCDLPAVWRPAWQFEFVGLSYERPRIAPVSPAYPQALIGYTHIRHPSTVRGTVDLRCVRPGVRSSCNPSLRRLMRTNK